MGSHVADVLSAEGFDVIVFDIRESPHLQKDQKMMVGDILNADDVNAAVKGCTFVYNMAGIADIDEAKDKALETAHVNIIGNLHILEAARIQGVKRFVFASTVYVYSESGSFYRASKQACERYIEAYHGRYGLEYSILRYGSLYGRRSDHRNGVFRMLRSALLEGKIRYYGSGEEQREYIHVSDAARLSVEILGKQYANQHVVLTGNSLIKAKDVMLMIKEMLGGKPELIFENRQLNGHYTITPYAFLPKVGRKLVANYHVDMGQGLIDCLAELQDRSENGYLKEDQGREETLE